MIKAKLQIYGQETHQPITISKGEVRQVYADFSKWLNALGLPTKEMKKSARIQVPNTTQLVDNQKRNTHKPLQS